MSFLLDIWKLIYQNSYLSGDATYLINATYKELAFSKYFLVWVYMTFTFKILTTKGLLYET